MTNRIAFLWWEDEVQWKDADQPFSKGWKSDNYAYFTDLGMENDLEIVCGEYRWYDEGRMQKAWYWNGNKWQRKQDVEIDAVYDLFRHDKEKYGLKKEMQQNVEVINDPDLSELCQDKFETYQEFEDLMVETRRATEENVLEMLEEHGKVVLKPRYGSGGHGIKKLGSKSEFDSVEDPENILVQEFIDTEGMPDFDVEGPHDLRMLFIDGKLVMSYIRTPDEGFRSNMDQGGTVNYVEIEDIPEKPREMAEEIEDDLERFSPYIVSVDFMYDAEGEPKLVELNSQPGIWVDRPVTEKEYEIPAAEELTDMLARTLRD